MQRARTELLYGEWLRRQRRRTDARGHLRAAIDIFRRLGADPWADRAEAELRATGETARKRDASAVDQLTPQELQIAGLVTDGLTNRDIAAQLYLSPRTVDYHLHKVFDVIGDLSADRDAPAMALALRPEVVIVDVTPAADTGFGIARRLRALLPVPPVVILTSSTDRTRFGARLDGHVFIAKADISSATIAQLARSPETDGLESGNP